MPALDRMASIGSSKMNLKISTAYSRRPAPYVLLFLVWGISGVMLSLPLVADWTWTEKAIFLLPPVVFTLIATLARPREGFTIWAFVLTLLVSQTGFQAQIGAITTSALEVCVLVLVGLLIFANGPGREHLVGPRDLPGYKWMIAFIVYSIALFIVGLLRGDPVSTSLMEFKGFLLYPLMIYLMLAGIRSERSLSAMILFMALWYAVVSGRAILDFFYHPGIALPEEVVYRSSGAYAPINIFGSSVVAVALLLLGISFSAAGSGRAWLYRGISTILILGAWTSVSRGVMVALAVGLFTLAFLSKRRALIVTGALVVPALIAFFALPPAVLQSAWGRIFQLSDSSTRERMFYLESGLRTLRVYWPVGAGWGNAFWYYAGVGLVPTGSIPWYHNDYLNLAVQAGVPGLLLYAEFWFSIFRALLHWLRSAATPVIGTPYVMGGIASLTALLTAAFFEHLLWRPDVAGLVVWVAGVAVVGMRLTSLNEESVDLRRE